MPTIGSPLAASQSGASSVWDRTLPLPQHLALRVVEEPLVGGDEGEAMHERRGDKMPIRRVTIWQPDVGAPRGNITRECGVPEDTCRQNVIQPSPRISLHLETSEFQ
jgi:hypothetical protein